MADIPKQRIVAMIVDVWAQIPSKEFMAAPWLSSLFRWTRGDMPGAPSVEGALAAMAEGGVDCCLISAWHGPQGALISNEAVARAVEEGGGKLLGTGSVDLTRPMEAVREVRRCRELGFAAIRAVPWLWNLPPNDRLYYPVYAACVEADLPFCTQIGHTGPLCRSEPGRPIPYLDDVLLDFPELVVVGGHVGYPWVEEVLSLARKYPNFYIDTSAYLLHRLPPALVGYMRGAGRERVMFGTNWPMLTPAQCLASIAELDLDPEARSLFLGGNARRVFGLA